MTRRALITGIAGQDGSYLAELLLAQGREVVGLDMVDLARAPNLAAVHERISGVRVDLADHDALRRAVQESGADEVYHLAAPSFVPDSWDDPTSTVSAIAGGTAALLAGALGMHHRPRVWVAASSEVFGNVSESPQNEQTPMVPRSPYGVAKLAALGLARNLREHHGLFACTGIMYNHESPRRPPHFLSRKVSRGAAAIALGLEDDLVLGDLEAVRDWSDARDVVVGATLMLAADDPRDYVLASGVGHTVREFVEAAFSAAGINGPVDRYVRVDPALVRPAELIRMVGDSSRARADLGWAPQADFQALVADMVACDLRELRNSAARGQPAP